jgi:Cu-processing system ATP-binding protein
LSDLDDLVTRIIYMQDGKLVFHKSMEELRRDTGEERLVKSIAQVMISNYE